ncbi:MAG TPA: hypothetical protein VN519_09440 [Bryobacteraceae bacterium]|nr:hypothetical protein [Bryobacteraceae bacterium]
MRYFAVILCSSLLFAAPAARAGVIPISHLDAASVSVFQGYAAKFDQQISAPFAATGKIWIDDDHSGRRRDFDAGKPVVDARENRDYKNASIHHYSGVIRVPDATIEQIRRVMKDYGNYPNYFKPGVVRGSGAPQPDSTPEDEHYQTRLFLTESTMGVDVAYDARYDCHYRRVAPGRWTSRATTISIRELQDPAKLDGALYPEGEDHGFLWRTNTYWFARERDGGLDLELDSVSLSRTAPMGLGWLGNRRAKDTVEKMLRDMKVALEKVAREATR